MSMALTFTQQSEILNKCVKNEASVSDVLIKSGLNLDDLIYETSNKSSVSRSLKGVDVNIIDDIGDKLINVPFVSFFSGAGGLDIGFKKAGYSHLASVEFKEMFCNTLRLNHPQAKIVGPPFYSGDVRNRDEMIDVLERIVGVSKDFEGVFHGGPPCQSFSIAANQRYSKSGDNFKRTGFDHKELGGLIFDYIFYIIYFRPKAFLIENVSGLISSEGSSQLVDAISLLKAAGYDVSGPEILNAAHYGVPQNRLRAFIIGNRQNKKYKFPDPLTDQVPCGIMFKKGASSLENHIVRDHKAESILRYAKLAYGSRDKLGRVDRLDPLKPSKTIIAGGTGGGGRSHLHPEIPRTMTVRESARLQTFPDDYVFTGPSARQFTQVGNAVPPLFAYYLAQSIKKIL